VEKKANEAVDEHAAHRLTVRPAVLDELNWKLVGA